VSKATSQTDCSLWWPRETAYGVVRVGGAGVRSVELVDVVLERVGHLVEVRVDLLGQRVS
jgi:hypothetical protein